MAEYIEINYLLHAIDADKDCIICDKHGFDCMGKDLSRQDICDIVENAPHADVRENVRGWWINEPDRYFHWHCSECEYVISGPHREFHYCPKCGTKMEGDK